MNKYVAIVTELGILKGRDCIYLDRVSFENGTSTLVMEGKVNGNLCSERQIGRVFAYVLKFNGLLALKMIELDSWDFTGESSFDEILDSDWIRTLGGKVTPSRRHFRIQTYDDVFDVVCSGYELRFSPATL